MSSTTTPNLALIKPTPGTKHPIQVSELNTNADRIDAASLRVVNVKAPPYNAVGDGVADDRAALVAAEAALGAAGGALHLPAGTYRVASDLTLGKSTHLVFLGGGMLAPAVGVTVTVQGSVQAGLYRLFAGAGTVRLSQPQTLYPEWWGAVADLQTSVTGASVTNGSTALTLSWASLTQADVGKPIVVVAAGAAGAPLVTTIAAVTDATHATLGAAAGTTVANGKAAYGTDSTAALKACIDQTTAAVHRIVLTGRYGATKVEIWPYTRLEGLAQMDFSGVYRLGTGAGGPFCCLAATAASAQGIALENLYFDAMFLGTLGGLELGTDAPVRALASGGYLRNVKVKNATGWAFDIRCNVALVDNLWAQHDVALPAGNTTAGGMRFIGTIVYARALSAEGPMPAGWFYLAAGSGSVYTGLQVEPSGSYATTDIVTFAANQQIVNGLYASPSTQRDLVRILTGIRDIDVNTIMVNAATYTLANILNDVDRAFTIPSPGTGPLAYARYWTTNSVGYGALTDPAAWTTSSPTWTGFSANPTAVSRYKQTGKTVVWSLICTAAGTSNATTLTATLPVTARAGGVFGTYGQGVDNGAALATPVRVDVSSTTVVTCYTTPAAGAWTNTGLKSVQFTLVYEAA